jgi:hypothetical protein
LSHEREEVLQGQVERTSEHAARSDRIRRTRRREPASEFARKHRCVDDVFEERFEAFAAEYRIETRVKIRTSQRCVVGFAQKGAHRR